MDIYEINFSLMVELQVKNATNGVILSLFNTTSPHCFTNPSIFMGKIWTPFLVELGKLQLKRERGCSNMIKVRILENFNGRNSSNGTDFRQFQFRKICL